MCLFSVNAAVRFQVGLRSSSSSIFGVREGTAEKTFHHVVATTRMESSPLRRDHAVFLAGLQNTHQALFVTTAEGTWFAW